MQPINYKPLPDPKAFEKDAPIRKDLTDEQLKRPPSVKQEYKAAKEAAQEARRKK